MAALVVWLWLCLRERLKPVSHASGTEDAKPAVVEEPDIPAPTPVIVPDTMADETVVVAAVTAMEHPSPPEPSPEADSAPPAIDPDDLTRIAGIGPKIASLLQAEGIRTFAQLAATDAATLRQVLAEAKLTHLADPATWPEQAELAAASRWDDLAALQKHFIRGRRV
jgi:predicted flap endonuclease-1-like 5' DNA nuclease